MAPIYKGDTEVLDGQLKIGNQDVKEVYLGSEKIWPPEPKIETVIYEHDVTPVAVTPDTSNTGTSVFFGNGYGLGFGATMNTGTSKVVYRQVAMRKNTLLDGDIDPMCVLRWYPEQGGGIPVNTCEHYWYPLVDVNSPDLPDGHKELWDQIEVDGGGRMTGSPIKGYRITFHKWHDLSRNTSGVASYRDTQWCSPASSFNQSFNNSTQTGGKVSAILYTPIGTLTTEYKKGYLAGYASLLNNVNNSNPYQVLVGDGYGQTVSEKFGQSWYWGIKKVEIIL